MTVLTGRVRERRPVYLAPDPCSRTSYVAGEIAQNDFWFPDIELPVGFGQTRTAKQLPVLTMVTGYSRTLFARLIPTRTAEDLYCGWLGHLSRLGAVPRVLVWDGEGAVGEYGGGRNKLTAECQAFRGTLGAKVLVLRPRDPEAKGIIERAHDYLERSFLPGRVFASPADFNNQLQAWLELVSRRTRRALGCAPTDRIAADTAAMHTLPPVAPVTGWRAGTRLPREGRLVADHDRVWANTRRCRTPSTSRPPSGCASNGSACCARFATPRSRSAAWATTTPRWAWATTKAGRRDGRRRQDPGRRHHRAGRVPDPRVEGADAARLRHPTGRTGPRRVLEP